MVQLGRRKAMEEGEEGGGGRGGKDIRARKSVISLPYYNDAIPKGTVVQYATAWLPAALYNDLDRIN